MTGYTYSTLTHNRATRRATGRNAFSAATGSDPRPSEREEELSRRRLAVPALC